MTERVQYILNKLKEVWQAHGREVGLFLGVFLVGIVGFESGLVEGQSIQSEPLVIEVPEKPVSMVQSAGVQSARDDTQKTTESAARASSQGAMSVNQNCGFVGSKNSNKYHLPTCAVVKRIKPENLKCFSSEEDAKSKGYTAGCLK